MENELWWKDEVDEHDYAAAEEYLSLLTTREEAKRLVGLLREAEIVTYKAKDLLRASELPLLPRDNQHVAKDIGKLLLHPVTKLSPILIVRDYQIRHPLIVADGYHRICASYYFGENIDIPCQIVHY